MPFMHEGAAHAIHAHAIHAHAIHARGSCTCHSWHLLNVLLNHVVVCFYPFRCVCVCVCCLVLGDVHWLQWPKTKDESDMVTVIKTCEDKGITAEILQVLHTCQLQHNSTRMCCTQRCGSAN